MVAMATVGPPCREERPFWIGLLLVPWLGAPSCAHGSAANSQGQFKVVVRSNWRLLGGDGLQ